MKRLNRKGVMDVQAFGSEPYSQEELVAEMGSAFLCGHCGILTKTETNSTAYLKHWLEKLKADPSLLVRAGAQAQKAYDYITGDHSQTDNVTIGQPLTAGAEPSLD